MNSDCLWFSENLLSDDVADLAYLEEINIDAVYNYGPCKMANPLCDLWILTSQRILLDMVKILLVLNVALWQQLLNSDPGFLPETIQLYSVETISFISSEVCNLSPQDTVRQ